MEDIDGKVIVFWKILKMMENGIEVVEDMLYDGIVVFFGSKYISFFFYSG